MSNGGQKRTRSQRVASLGLSSGRTARLLGALSRPALLKRLGVALLALVAVWAVSPSWYPPFEHRMGHTPQRDLTARVHFRVPNPQATEDARSRARRQARTVYELDRGPIVQLRAELQNTVAQLLTPEKVEEVDLALWRPFVRPKPGPNPAPWPDEVLRQQLDSFRDALGGGEDPLMRFNELLTEVFGPLEQTGFLKELQHSPEEGNQKELLVAAKGDPPDRRQLVQVSDLLEGEVLNALARRFRERLDTELAVGHLMQWLRPKLPAMPSPLRLDEAATQEAREAAMAAVEPQFTDYRPGQVIVPRGTTIDLSHVALLKLERETLLQTLSLNEIMVRALATLGLVLGLFVLCGQYLLWREPLLVHQVGRLCGLLGLVVVTLVLTRLLGTATGTHVLPFWRAEILPVLLFGIAAAIVYSQQTALVLSAAVLLLLVLVFGQNLTEGVVLSGALATAILMLNRVRTRSKIIAVGFYAGLVAFALTIVLGALEHQPLAMPLWFEAARNFFWPIVAGFLISGLLPFIERGFGVVTDISLLELGDVSHPLLQELVRRAPGTYNHSITVATLGEAAAEAIGASGLLVRVGAYFHDIGKMLKPNYFVENQTDGGDRHQSLVPAMSTLVIIAHVKDGADLARKHNLPQAIIDFIEQHHGTTLVAYFYERASQLSPEGGEVDETTFRYPGPKPQTKEAAVLMLADAVEGACRTLVEPKPKAIEDLVRQIAKNRLLDSQFDECGLSLCELRTIEDSLIKSLTAIYHGRIVYPGQTTARAATV